MAYSNPTTFHLLLMKKLRFYGILKLIAAYLKSDSYLELFDVGLPADDQRLAVLLDSGHQVVPSLSDCVESPPYCVRCLSIRLVQSSDQLTAQLR